MDKLIVLGTGHAGVTRCYNTCFLLNYEEDYILVDAGGGNGILAALENLQIPISKIHNAFITHKHTDHLLGIVWIIRMICQEINAGRYEGEFNIYCHDELVSSVQALAKATFDKKFLDIMNKHIHINIVSDGEVKELAGYEFTFFDIHSTKAKQYGFKVQLHNGKMLTFLGDEPYNPLCEKYVRDSDWLLAEAFCLYKERDIFKPYAKHHSTVKDACELACDLNIKNLVLWHTEDKNLENRKELYIAEGKNYYTGNLFVPYDLEIIELR